MADRSKVIFGNVISDKDYKKALKSKKKFAKKYGDDSAVDYKIKVLWNLDRVKENIPLIQQNQEIL